MIRYATLLATESLGNLNVQTFVAALIDESIARWGLGNLVVGRDERRLEVIA